MRESFVEFEKFLLSLNARRGVSVCGGESDELAVLCCSSACDDSECLIN